jgi:hypothetical protein
MTRKGQAAGGHAAFIAELRALHQRCGKPAYKQLTDISEKLSEFYPLPQGERYRLVTLSPAAISEILKGKRANLPKLEWVASFVLSCQRWAHRIGAAAEDPGLSSMPEWADRWVAAHGDEAADRKCVVRLTPDQQALLASYGACGRAVASQAEAGDPGAVYDAALLLGTSPAHRDDARALLTVAAATRHRPSSSLIDDDPGRMPSFFAACLARAHRADAEGHPDQAEVFRQAAARGRTAGDPTTPAGHGTGQHQNGSGDPATEGR